MEISDDTLVDNIRGGDSDAFAVIVERYKIQIYNLMYRYSGSSEEAADMAQDVFCRAFERLGHYRKQHSFFAWLYTLALNYARDWARKRSRREQTIDTFVRESDAHETIQPEHLVEAGQRAKGLIAALGMLAEDRREMVLLKYRHDCSIKEIAEIFEISDSAVKMRLKRALDELGQKLKN
ncbi:MAG: RNA polymerase sigma factor [Desulfofustis sp.]|jgi:RNA polymerase sigma-70 factor, ECF subfamily